MTSNSSNSSRGKSGNTKQISPSKHWCFTLNNYTNENIEFICSNSSIEQYIFQEETGDKGTPHLQGYIKFKSKVRPLSIFKSTSFHWEKTRDIKRSIAYCQKEDTRTGKVFSKGIKIIKPLKCIKTEQLYDWQKSIVALVQDEPNDRHIHWYWETVGNVGKSAMVRYLCIKHDAIIVSGKSADIKYQIKMYVDKHNTGPDIIIYDIPRTAENYVNYGALEEVKNGLFASNKYESSMIIINPPHFLCFANFEPMYNCVSLNRWKIHNLGEDEASL